MNLVEQLKALSTELLAAGDLAERLCEADPDTVTVEELEEFLRRFDGIEARLDALYTARPGRLIRFVQRSLQGVRETLADLRRELDEAAA